MSRKIQISQRLGRARGYAGAEDEGLQMGRGIPDLVGAEVAEALGAVATEEGEAVAGCTSRKAILQGAALPGENQGGHAGDGFEGRADLGLNGVVGLLEDLEAPPAGRAPVVQMDAVAGEGNTLVVVNDGAAG